MPTPQRDTDAGATTRQGGDVPEKAGSPCASCDGLLDGTETGWVCRACVRDWQDWHREERAANKRFVDAMMGSNGWRYIREGYR